MRTAILSDIHGNLIALEAVLEDIMHQGGVDAYWILGDLVAIGPDPIGVLDRLHTLPNASFTRGNTDRYIVTGERPSPKLKDVATNLELLPLFKQVTDSFSWTQGAIAVSGYWNWLAGLTLEHRTTLPDATRVLGVHASAGEDDGVGVRPNASEDDLRKLFQGCKAELVFVGHTHSPSDHRVDGVRILNLGSVSNPLPPDLRASYIILHTDHQGHSLHHRRVDYDHDAVIGACERVRHPAANYIASFMRGQVKPIWLVD